MTAKDKTRQKLVDSMRKTKGTASDKPTPSAKQTSATNTDSQSKPSRQPSPPAKQAQRIPASNQQHGTDPYQSGGRIWPD